MEVKLIIEKGAKSQTIRLQRTVATVGRQSGCQLRIPSSAVSRQHCRLRWRDDCLVVEDLDSANGTYLNGTRIERPRFVRPGDRLEVGPLTFRVEYPLSTKAIERFMSDPEGSTVGDEDLELIAVEVLDEGPAEEEEELVAVEVTDEEPIPVDEDALQIAEDDTWRLPAEEDVRDILSKMDESKSDNAKRDE
jgi:predicted component of type VI protein secretion system